MTSLPSPTRVVLPVIHFLNAPTAKDQAELAFRAGADGVFLISHSGQDESLFVPAREIKKHHPDKLVGLNLLGAGAYEALLQTGDSKLDMVWADAPGVSSTGLTDEGFRLKHALVRADRPRFYGSVAFKYQPHEPHPGYAAKLAADCGMLPTTSGPGTGVAPDVEKLRLMHEALGGRELAIASGMTPENVAAFLPYVSHYLVATGVSTDMYHFDEERLTEFVRIVKSYQPVA